MEGEAVSTILALAFGLGLLHALDADHILAVTTLACTRPRRRAALVFCVRWAVGHGLTLLAIGGAVLLLGLAVPRELSHWAERLVGVILIGVGGWVLFDLARRRLRLGVHRHYGMPAHAHWQEPRAARHGHGAVLVGIVHGTAGSAPLLAVLPVAAGGAPWLGLAYLLIFGLGVLAMMLLCGGLLGGLWHRLADRGERVLTALRAVVALGAIGFGGYWLAGA